jgi:hypothetical protein
MSNRIDETIVLLVQLDFSYQETGIQNESENNRGEEKNTEEKQNALTPVENDPSDVQCHSQRYQADA